MQNIQNIINSQKGSNTNKAWSLIGSYGSGKSSFALYLSHLLSNPKATLGKHSFLSLVFKFLPYCSKD
jgi:ABC-type dipeptide/oligopeptide/nickel transport system ATPase component